jgi:ATP phosphoribosyltransferase regulatory subunit
MATKFRYPTGVRPLLVEEAARRKRIEARVTARLESDGFDEVFLPIIDYVEPYVELRRGASAKQSYRFVDREGELVAIRSDFTPMVARALAPTIAEPDLPLRIFYRGDVIRVEATRLGANREMFQIGAEIIGDPSVNADIEALRLAADLARAAGATPVIIYNDVSIANALGDEAREALVSKRIARDGSLPELAVKILDGTATLEDVRGFAPAAADRLDAIARGAGSECLLQLDDVDAGAGYYTGIHFRVYDADTRKRLAEGGRYDDLYGRFGTAAAAIGFTFTIDDAGQASARPEDVEGVP